MAIYRCKMCGGDLQIEAGSSVCVCEYCGTKQTVPSADSEKKMTLFARANRILRDCEFDKAAGVFESIIADFPNEAEAYWGLVLCKYGIEYVDDPATGRKVPTCHRSSFDIVMDDANYQLAIKNADVVAKEIYRSEGAQIEELRRDILEISSKEDPYDIFICYKETDEKGERTLDSVLAQDVYDALIDKGYRVFFSRITLEDMLGTEFEPHIFAALRSSKIMLVFGTKPEYFDAVWVRNEWSRFLSMVEKGENKYLIPCYKNMAPQDMPKEFARLQAQDMGKVGAMQDLLRGIDKILVPQKNIKIETKESQKQGNWKKYILIVAGALVLIIVLAIIFDGKRENREETSVQNEVILDRSETTSDPSTTSINFEEKEIGETEQETKGPDVIKIEEEIDKIGEFDITDHNKIIEIENEYSQLRDDQKSQIRNYDILQEAKKEEQFYVNPKDRCVIRIDFADTNETFTISTSETAGIPKGSAFYLYFFDSTDNKPLYPSEILLFNPEIGEVIEKDGQYLLLTSEKVGPQSKVSIVADGTIYGGGTIEVVR